MGRRAFVPKRNRPPHGPPPRRGATARIGRESAAPAGFQPRGWCRSKTSRHPRVLRLLRFSDRVRSSSKIAISRGLRRLGSVVVGSAAVIALIVGIGPPAVTLAWRMLRGTNVVLRGYSFVVPAGWVVAMRDEGGVSILFEGPTPGRLLRIIASRHPFPIPGITIGASPDDRDVGIDVLLMLVPKPSRRIPAQETGAATCAEGPVPPALNSFEMIECEWPGGISADYAGNDRALFLKFVRSVRRSRTNGPLGADAEAGALSSRSPRERSSN